MGKREVVWGYFLARVGQCYDLQGLFATEQEARDTMHSTLVNPTAWRVLSTGRHWVAPDLTVIRISPLEIGLMRGPEDSDPAGLREEILTMLGPFRPDFGASV